MRRAGETGGQGGSWPPDFVSSVNPISTMRMTYYVHQANICPPDFQTFRWLWTEREGWWKRGARGHLTLWILEHQFLFKPGDGILCPSIQYLFPGFSDLPPALNLRGTEIWYWANKSASVNHLQRWVNVGSINILASCVLRKWNRIF